MKRSRTHAKPMPRRLLPVHHAVDRHHRNHRNHRHHRHHARRHLFFCTAAYAPETLVFPCNTAVSPARRMHETFPHTRKTDAAPLAARTMQLTDTTVTTVTTCAGDGACHSPLLIGLLFVFIRHWRRLILPPLCCLTVPMHPGSALNLTTQYGKYIKIKTETLTVFSGQP
jgi:hypothetical protein